MVAISITSLFFHTGPLTMVGTSMLKLPYVVYLASQILRESGRDKTISTNLGKIVLEITDAEHLNEFYSCCQKCFLC